MGCPNTMFNFDGAVLPDCGSSCANIVVHDCLSSGGQSGSAIWSGNNTGNYTVRANCPFQCFVLLWHCGATLRVQHKS